MGFNDHREGILRRLGRDWERPEERMFVRDYLAGRVPVCPKCGIAWSARFYLDHEDRACDYCHERLDHEAEARWYRMVPVKEGPVLSATYWFWYPHELYSRDSTMEILWRHFAAFRTSARARARLGGEWDLVPEAQFEAQLGEDFHPFGRRRRYLRLDRNDNSYLWLPSSSAAGSELFGGGRAPADSRWARPCTVLHAGHPRSRHPKRGLPRRYRKDRGILL